ncbi:MAG: GGDEF domain-containing protein [Elusimicrobia bacterium]|nr:GGDEF domain-containing protein [Elusimicrobiota bacterium]
MPWRALFENLPVAATVVDRFGHVLKINQEARRLAGERPDIAHGQTCRQYWRCRVPENRCALRRVISTGKPVYRAPVPVRGHRENYLIERISAFRGPDGRRRAVIVTGPATVFFRWMRALRHQARVDELTGVLNRGSFDALTLRARQLERRCRPAAFVMMDVDGLKSVNDRFGHAAGDRLLSRLGQLLRNSARRGDVIGRLGGDEFAIYCPGTTRATAQALVRRLRRSVQQDNALNPDQPSLSVQFGVACTERLDGDLRQKADRFLYGYKRYAARRLGRPPSAGPGLFRPRP